MLSFFYTGVTGAITASQGFDVTSNNIANVSTSGYKPVKTSFEDLIYSNLHTPAGANTQAKAGHGAKVASTDTVYAMGSLRETGRTLDFAPTGTNQYFAVRTPEGVRYTRSGDFHLSQEGGAFYLTASDGGYVLGADGQRIAVANETDEIPVGVFSFANEDGLIRRGDTAFEPGELSGPAQAAAQLEVKRGYLEESGVDLTEEMTSVIRLQRAFQMNSKMVVIADELMQTVNGLR